MRHFAYTELVEHKRKRHEVQCFLDILGSLGINEADESLEFWLSDDVRERSNEILEDLGISRGEEFILLHPETPTHGGQRQWPEPKYSELGRLVGRTGRKKIVIGGTMQDRAAGARITTRIGNNAVLLPPLRLMEYAGLMQKAKAIVCGNTGIMHLACALGVPVVALHGPTDPVKWGPRGNQCVALASKLECSPCLYLGYEYGCKTNRCMNMISVEEVRAALGKIVA
jgi:ADP-heptose:LPS heptosyltransferase